MSTTIRELALHSTSPRDRVIERLEFVKRLDVAMESFAGGAFHISNDTSWDNPTYRGFDALRIYLLLTCFDILGQGKEYRNFDAWLASKKHAAEVQAAEKGLAADLSHAQAAKALFEVWLRMYGVKRGFFRFIDETLPRPQRDTLFLSVNRREVNVKTNTAVDDGVKGPPDVREFLYDLRNSYTHGGVAHGSAGGSITKAVREGFVSHDGRRLFGYVLIGYVLDGDVRIDYSVRRWPDVLIETVRAGLEVTP